MKFYKQKLLYLCMQIGHLSIWNTTDKKKKHSMYIFFLGGMHIFINIVVSFHFFFSLHILDSQKIVNQEVFFYLRLYPQLQKLRLRACHTPILYKFSLPALWCLLITRVMPRPTTMPFHTHCLKKKYSGYGRAANRSWKEMKKKKMMNCSDAQSDRLKKNKIK